MSTSLNHEGLAKLAVVLQELDNTGATVTQVEFCGKLIFLGRDDNGAHYVQGLSSVKEPKAPVMRTPAISGGRR
jgi:hypothetical protein